MSNFPAPPPLVDPPQRRSGLLPGKAPSSPNPYVQKESSDSDGSFSYFQGGGGGGGDVQADTPGPYFSLSDMTLPVSPRDTFEYCRSLALSSPVHRAYVRNMAVLPIREIQIRLEKEPSDPVDRVGGYDSPKEGLEYAETDASREVSDFYLKTMKLKTFAQEVGFSFHTYQNTVVIMSYPFTKLVTCSKCGGERDSTIVRRVSDRIEVGDKGDLYIRYECPDCNTKNVQGLLSDRHRPGDRNKIRPVILDTMHIYGLRNDFTGQVSYYYEVPRESYDRLVHRDCPWEFTSAYPQAYLKACLRQDRGSAKTYQKSPKGLPLVALVEGQYYALRAANMPIGTNGLAMPAMVATFKDTWMLRKLQKSSEVVADQYIVPFTVMYPADTPGKESLIRLLDMGDTMEKLTEMVSKHQKDPGMKVVSPFPVGSHTVGGEGKALTLSNEIRVYWEVIAAGNGAPIEFVMGGLQYSASSVSIRQMEAVLTDSRDQISDLLQWITDKTSEFADNVPKVVVSVGDLRMGDDLPYIQMTASLQASGQVSLSTLHRSMGINTVAERRDIRNDTRFMNELEAERARDRARTDQDAIFSQTNAQVEAQAQAPVTTLLAQIDLMGQLKNNRKLREFVSRYPDQARQTLGTLVDELLREGRGEPPGTTYMQQVSPEMLGTSVSPPAAMGAAASQQEQPDRSLQAIQQQDELVEQLVGQAASLQPGEWTQWIATLVRPQYGDAIADAVQARLMMASSTINQAPLERPPTSRRPGISLM